MEVHGNSGSGNGVRTWADMKGFAVQVITGRWLMLFASFLMMASAGASYMFGLYSNDIKSVLGYSQSTLNTISFFKDLGANIGIFSGLINEVTPPWVVLSIGAAFNFFGYFMIWLAVAEKIAKPQVWHMCLYITMGANSHTFINTGALVTCVKNFPRNRGLLIGLLEGYIGLSAAVIAQIYHALYGNDTKSFTLFVAWLPSAISLIFLRTIRIMKVIPQKKYSKVLQKFFFISLGLAGYLLIIIIVQQKVKFTQFEYGGSAAVVLFLLFLPLAVVVAEEYTSWRTKTSLSTVNTEISSLDSPPVDQIMVSQNKEMLKVKKLSCWENVFSPPEIGQDYTILQAIFSIEMLTLFLTTLCGLGGMLTLMDNLGQIGTALGYSLESITTFVSLASIWIYLGEVMLGFLSEVFITKYKIPRPLTLTVSLLVSCIGHLLIAFNVPNGLYVASIITGFCFGGQWPLIFAIISEVFGLKHCSTLNNVGVMACPLGSYLLNVKVTGYLYDKEAEKQLKALGLERKPGEGLNCTGGQCYKLPFLIITGATILGVFFSLILVLRTWKFYNSDIYKKFKDESRAVESDEVVATNRNVGLVSKPETETDVRSPGNNPDIRR
ncbi:hypothetical protein C1H46_014305 [Malus baccata]|uniref:Uncharacterized protein n=1 Tax=Malus baccata TaxID=106549 RepID=A0A540MMS0_MALBA|nr:hypothetical protein C1H46_014305 [Malus baccata]